MSFSWRIAVISFCIVITRGCRACQDEMGLQAEMEILDQKDSRYVYGWSVSATYTSYTRIPLLTSLIVETLC